MFFGGSNGFNSFYISDIKDNTHVPPIVITDFQVLNEPVTIGGVRSPLKQAITETRELKLSYKHYVFSFDFAALDFTAPSKNKYACKMEGFDKQWIHRDSSKRFVTYTNLKPGKYVFRVKGSNNDGVWNEEGVSIPVFIIPPFWKTWLFRHVLILTFAVLSYLIINFVRNYIALHGFWKREKYIGKYKLDEKLAAGGMGTIYRAHHTQKKTEPVAIKVLREELFADENYRKRFEQEAAIVDQLDHPHIVKILERGQHKQKLFIIMELLKGKTLAKRIAEESLIPLDEVFYIMLQIADALMTIHSMDIVHRDLKPENVMLVEKEGKANFVKLLDFGLAKALHQTRITQTGTVLGTLNYMAPEQISVGEFSTASDVYSLGVVLYEAVTGHVPFPGDGMTHIMRQIMSRVPSPPLRVRNDLPPDLNTLIMKMMKKEISERPSLDDVIEALKGLRSSS
jgi:tRNA A-37 threonylcarbamoyl transferase component Bud32